MNPTLNKHCKLYESYIKLLKENRKESEYISTDIIEFTKYYLDNIETIINENPNLNNQELLHIIYNEYSLTH